MNYFSAICTTLSLDIAVSMVCWAVGSMLLACVTQFAVLTVDTYVGGSPGSMPYGLCDSYTSAIEKMVSVAADRILQIGDARASNFLKGFGDAQP